MNKYLIKQDKMVYASYVQPCANVPTQVTFTVPYIQQT